MGILQFVKKVCVQDAIYWGNPVVDGFGSMSFDDPISIKVRWDERQQLVVNTEGKEELSKAAIMCPDELDLQGFVMLGSLEDVADGDTYKTPQEVNAQKIHAMEIKSRSITPLFRSKVKFIYVYYLSPQLR
jgi:hypothetical protein